MTALPLSSSGWNRQPFNHVLAVPLMAEEAAVGGLMHSLSNQHTAGRLLVIAVINESAATFPRYLGSNRATVAAVEAAFGVRSQRWSEDCFVVETPRVTALLINRFEQDHLLPSDNSKGGVGLARKIACDTAVYLHAKGCVSARVIHSTDGDATLPADYLSRTDGLGERHPNWSLALYPYQHVADAAAGVGTAGDGSVAEDRLVAAHRAYEVWLRYYQAGLQFARSPYAFATIGSTFAFPLKSYVAVRGFPRRTAGEDFYLANKLAKIGTVVTLSGSPIGLQCRASTRVPFGTGRSALRIAEDWQQGKVYSMHDPRVFSVLRGFLWAVEARLTAGQATDWDIPSACVASGGKGDSLRKPLAQFLAKEAEPVVNGLLPTSSRNPIEGLRRFHEVFDGLKTRQLIHRCRDLFFPDVSFNQALAEAPFATDFS